MLLYLGNRYKGEIIFNENYFKSQYDETMDVEYDK